MKCLFLAVNQEGKGPTTVHGRSRFKFVTCERSPPSLMINGHAETSEWSRYPVGPNPRIPRYLTKYRFIISHHLFHDAAAHISSNYPIPSLS